MRKFRFDYNTIVYKNIIMRILLAEDDSSIREVLKMALESNSYTVDAACNGEEAVYFSKINQYDLIVLDIIMPQKSGFEACREMRAHGIKIPILILSSKNDVLSKIELLNSGADDYITKPFSFEELLARLKSLSRRPKNIADEVLVAGRVKLNTNTQEVFVKNKRIYLTRKEFSILELMMRHPGKLITRSMLLEHAWDMNANPFSNTIESHILNLRKKLGDKQKQIIRSLPGRGYKISELVVN